MGNKEALLEEVLETEQERKDAKRLTICEGIIFSRLDANAIHHLCHPHSLNLEHVWTTLSLYSVCTHSKEVFPNEHAS